MVSMVNSCYTLREKSMKVKKIYSILLEKCPDKSKNKRFLRRYIKFLLWCNKNNSTTKCEEIKEVYYEKHHILPKAKTFWPQYKNFNKFPWNEIKLTPRQHYIAHYLLAKTYGGGMWFALSMFLPKHIKLKNSGSCEFHMHSRIYERVRKETVLQIKKINKIVRPPNDKEILLAHIMNENFGFDNKLLHERRWVNDGETELMTNYKFLPKWVFNGRIETFKQLNIKNASNGKGKIWFNNGTIELMCLPSEEPIDFVKGRLKGQKRKGDSRKGRRNPAYGKCWFTNGIDDIFVNPHDAPDGFVRGNTKSKKQKTAKGSTIYNNGDNEIRIYTNETPPEGYQKGRLKFKCPHCSKEGMKGNMNRYHFDNCKERGV